MQHGAEVGQKYTQSEPMPDRGDCPDRVGWVMRDGKNFGCRVRRQIVGCVG